MRYTTQDQNSVERDDVPLLDRHVKRLRHAHAYFAARDAERWGNWPGDDVMWRLTQDALCQAKEGDWRVRVVVHPGPKIEVQVVPAPTGLAPFCWRPEAQQPQQRRPLILDSEEYDCQGESTADKEKRLFKTTAREIYDEAGARASRLHPDIVHPEVLLHTATHLLESITSNIAIQTPIEGGSLKWITPHLCQDKLPFLDGVMRQYLIEEGIVQEGEVTVSDWFKAKLEGRRVIGFNGLRGIWEALPM